MIKSNIILLVIISEVFNISDHFSIFENFLSWIPWLWDTSGVSLSHLFRNLLRPLNQLFPFHLFLIGCCSLPFLVLSFFSHPKGILYINRSLLSHWVCMTPISSPITGPHTPHAPAKLVLSPSLECAGIRFNDRVFLVATCSRVLMLSIKLQHIGASNITFIAAYNSVDPKPKKMWSVCFQDMKILLSYALIWILSLLAVSLSHSTFAHYSHAFPYDPSIFKANGFESSLLLQHLTPFISDFWTQI